MTSPATEDMLFETRGPVAFMTLNRPKALNALNLDMIRAMDPKLKEYAADPAIKAVVLQGAGDRAFCAGGDVRRLAELGIAQRAETGSSDTELGRAFFFEEYVLNRNIFRFPKPYISLLDGITMGGGKGLSAHGSHRVVTEKTLFAMPETGIGLFPDVGGGYFLPRCPGETGVYLSLTGERIEASDCLHIGFGTHFVPSDKLEALRDALVSADWPEAGQKEATTAVANQVIDGYAGDPGPAPMATYRDKIDRHFGHDTLEEIVSSLEADGSDWATKQAETLKRMSPTSLKISLRQLREGALLDLEAVLTMEYRMSQGCMTGHDFFEGIRAQLIDKDRSPKWNPVTLDEVTEAEVDRHFAPLGDRDLLFTDA